MTQRQPSSASGTPLCGSFEAHDPKRYYYSTVPITQPPPVAYMKHGKHLQERPRAEAKRVQTSFSSATSATSDLSYKKHSTPSPEENWASPTLEQTLVDGEQRPSAQVGSAGSRKAGHGQRESQMAERTSPAVTYIQERRRISEEIEEEDSDHAVWILVSNACYAYMHRVANTVDSSGCQSLTPYILLPAACSPLSSLSGCCLPSQSALYTRKVRSATK